MINEASDSGPASCLKAAQFAPNEALEPIDPQLCHRWAKPQRLQRRGSPAPSHLEERAPQASQVEPWLKQLITAPSKRAEKLLDSKHRKGSQWARHFYTAGSADSVDEVSNRQPREPRIKVQIATSCAEFADLALDQGVQCEAVKEWISGWLTPGGRQ